LAYRPLLEAWLGGDIKLVPMTRQELGQAIEKPAEMQGVTFETGLVERILDSVGDEPGNLPLLAFTLTVLWERQATGHLTHAGYEAIGQVTGNLAAYADETYVGLSPMEQAQAQQIFMRLVRPGQQTADTRRRVRRAEFDEDHWALVQRLAAARLVVTDLDRTGQETVEMVHDALISGWERLQAWLNEDRGFHIWHEWLRASLGQWEASHRDEDALLRGVLLVEAEERLKTHPAQLSPPAHEFLQASIAWREKQGQEKQRRAESEQQRAEAQVKVTSRLRWLATCLLIISLLAVGAGLLLIAQ